MTARIPHQRRSYPPDRTGTLKMENPLSAGARQRALTEAGHFEKPSNPSRPILQANPVARRRHARLMRLAPFFAEARHG